MNSQIEMEEAIRRNNLTQETAINMDALKGGIPQEKNSIESQTKRIKNLFMKNPNVWIPLPEIMKLAAQYNARIYQLRKKGMDIINKTEKEMGTKHSWYKYTPEEINS